MFSTNKKNIPLAPSFNTAGSTAKMTKNLSFSRMGHVIFTGEPNWPFSKSDNIDLKQFYQGSRKAIETISKSISQSNFARLDGLVSPECMGNLRSSVFENFGPKEISLLAIREEDIFFQFIENSKVSEDFAQIDLVSFSLNNLAQCKINTTNLKNLKESIQRDVKKKGGVLKREDFNASQFRQISDQFEGLNPNSLVKDNEVHITNYKFEKSGDQEWQIVKIGHLNTTRSWSWLRKFKWKGRVHISMQFNMPFKRVLRYDYMIDAGLLAMLIYLQILALIIGSNIEIEKKERGLTNSDVVA